MSRSIEQEPAFQVKPLCFETGTDSWQIFKQFSQNICTLPSKQAWSSLLLSSTAPLHSQYSSAEALISGSYLVPTTHENVFNIENKHSFVVLLMFLYLDANSNFNTRRWHRT